MLITDREVKKTIKKQLTRKTELLMGEREGVFCRRCGRRLYKPESMERYAGAICDKHLHLEEAFKNQLKLFDI